MNTLARAVKEVIDTRNYWFDLQYSHPEFVPESALQLAEDSAEIFFNNISDEEIQEYTSKAIKVIGETVSVEDVLTDIAGANCDYSGFTTIVCAVQLKLG